MKNRWVSLAKVLIVNVLVLIFLLGALEGIGWLLVDKPSDYLVNSWRLNHTWKPNTRQVHSEWIASNPAFPEPYTHVYNRQGWIETYDIDTSKPPNTYRIFYLGDSLIEGTAPMDQSVPSLVEKHLNEIAGSHGLRFEVINTGTSSYSPLIHYVLIRYVLLKYEPDLIVLNVDMSDEMDDWKYHHTAVYDNDGNPYAVPPQDALSVPFIDTPKGAVKATPINRILLFLYRQSYFYNLLQQKLFKKAGTELTSRLDLGEVNEKQYEQLYQRYSWCRHRWEKQTIQNATRTFEMLERIARLCQQHGIKLMLTATPHYPQYNGRVDGTGPPVWSAKPHYVLAKLSQHIGVPYLNAYEQLIPVITGTPQTTYYYKGDVHLNPDGYQIWAKTHIAFLTDPSNKLLPGMFPASPAKP